MDLNTAPSTRQHLSKEFDLGDCIFYAQHCELYSKKNQKVLHIEKKVAEVLHCLASAKGDVVTREEIFDQVWPNMMVSDDSLNRCISVLRKKLKSFDHQLTIKTHPKVGFNLQSPCFNCQKAQGDISGIPQEIPQHTEPIAAALSQQLFVLKLLLALVSLALALSVWWYWQQNSSRIITTEKHQLIILPFTFEDDITQGFDDIEQALHQSMSNHPAFDVITNTLPQIAGVNPNPTEITPRFTLQARAFRDKARAILHWTLTDELTHKELINEQLNLLLNPLAINVRKIASSLSYQVAREVHQGDHRQQIDLILTTANYLFQPISTHALQAPEILMLAQALDDIDNQSTRLLKQLAELLTASPFEDKQRNQAHIELAITVLTQAQKLSANDVSIYQALAQLYLLNYQWHQARTTIMTAQSLLSTQPTNGALNPRDFARRTGHLTELWQATVGQNYQAEPLNNEYLYQLIEYHLDQQQTEQAMTLFASGQLNDDNIARFGLLIGPTLIRHNRQPQGQLLTIQGYQSLGLSMEQINHLVTGIENQDYRAHASDQITALAEENKLSNTAALAVYSELADLDRFFELALTLAEKAQFDIVSTLKNPDKQLRADPRFAQLTEKIGLTAYWQTYGFPDFCLQPPNQCATSSGVSHSIN